VEIKMEELALGFLVDMLDKVINSYELLPKLGIHLLKFFSDKLFLAFFSISLESTFPYLGATEND
jgi:hypothetical protein